MPTTDPAQRLALAAVEVARTIVHPDNKGHVVVSARAELHGLARAADYYGAAMTPAAFELAAIEVARENPPLVMLHCQQERRENYQRYQRTILEAFAVKTCITI